MGEYRKLVDVLGELKAEKAQRERDINKLRAIINAPIRDYDEQAAARRIFDARTADRLNETDNAGKVVAQIEQERVDHAKKCTAQQKERQAAINALKQQEPYLPPIEEEITRIEARLKAMTEAHTRKMLDAARDQYRQAVTSLADATIQLDALSIILEGNQKIGYFIHGINTLPNVGIQLQTPWHGNDSPTFHMQHKSAYEDMHARVIKINEQTHGELYEQ